MVMVCFSSPRVVHADQTAHTLGQPPPQHPVGQTGAKPEVPTVSESHSWTRSDPIHDGRHGVTTHLGTTLEGSMPPESVPHPFRPESLPPGPRTEQVISQIESNGRVVFLTREKTFNAAGKQIGPLIVRHLSTQVLPPQVDGTPYPRRVTRTTMTGEHITGTTLVHTMVRVWKPKPQEK
jgi:hypothetical protein